MRVFAAHRFAFVALSAFALSGAQPAEKKAVKAPLAPTQGVKTPGIQIPFANVTAEATLQPADKPAWTFYMSDAPAGGGNGGGGGRGGGRGGGGRGAGGGAAAPAAPAAVNGNLFIPAKDKLEKFETKTNKAGAAVAGITQPCGGMVSAFGSLWVPACGDGTLQRIDAKTAKVTATIASGAANIRGSITASTDSIWLLTDSRETLSRIDPEQNAVVGEIRLPPGCTGLTYAEAALWIACPEQNKVLHINPATNVVDKRIDVSGRPLAIAAGETSIWVLCGEKGKVDRIDPKTDKVMKTIDLMTPNIEGGIAVSDGYVWVTATGFPLTRIDPTPEKEMVAQQFWGEGGGASVIATAGALWLTNMNAGTVWRIDPKLILATLAE